VDGLISAAAGSDWSYGASILTFAFPMILFIAVAGALYVLYTKPHLVPGHRYLMDGQHPSNVPAAPRASRGQPAASGQDQPASGGTEDS
jgi:hypothetical protein